MVDNCVHEVLVKVNAQVGQTTTIATNYSCILCTKTMSASFVKSFLYMCQSIHNLNFIKNGW